MAFRRPKRLLPLAGAAVFLLLVLALIAAKVSLTLKTVFDAHAGWGLTQEDVLTAHDLIVMVDPDRPAVVPKLIHQIFHNWDNPVDETIPPDWDEMRQSILQFNPDYEYKLWTASSSRQFIESEYPWFLRTYDRLPHPVQRIDALRYFLMRHFGGIYIDLDNGCTTSMDSLRYYPAWVLDSGEGPLNNNVLGAEPNHPFWVMVTENIQSYAYNYFFPYITVSYGTGQWFETIMWQKYHREKPGHADPLTRIRLDRHMELPLDSPIFTNGRGLTWHSWDNHMFIWIRDNMELTVAFVFVGIVALSIVLYLIWRFLRPSPGRHSRRYAGAKARYDAEGGKAD